MNVVFDPTLLEPSALILSRIFFFNPTHDAFASLFPRVSELLCIKNLNFGFEFFLFLFLCFHYYFFINVINNDSTFINNFSF